MLTERVERLQPSKTMYFTARAREMRREGISIMDFSVGEPDFQTPENVCRAACKAIREGKTKYTVVNGIPELREALSEKLYRENGILCSPEQICVGTGAKQPLFNAVFALCEQGDQVLIPTPSWVSYEEMVRLAGAEPVFVECLARQGFALDLAAVEAAVTLRTKAIIINTPNNPTGAVYSQEQLRKLGQLAVKYGFYVIADEVYEKLVFDGRQHVSIASLSEEIKDRCVVVNGFSKSFAMTGWRIGYAVANDEIISAIKSIQSHTTSASNSITQYAALEALRGPQDFHKVMHDAFEERRNHILKRIAHIPYVTCNQAPGAFYLMLEVSGLYGKNYGSRVISGSVSLAELLLTEAHIAFIAGEVFHSDRYLRMCYAVSMEEIEEGIDRLEAFLQKVK